MIKKPSGNIMDKAKAYKTTEDRSERRTIIYVFVIPDDAHKGMCKIGMTTDSDSTRKKYKEHCKKTNNKKAEFSEENDSPYLQFVANLRIKNITGTAHDKHRLCFAGLGYNTLTHNFFTDGTVHSTIRRAGYPHVSTTKDVPGQEWYRISPSEARRAVVATQHGHSYITPKPKQNRTVRLRPDQAKFVKDTVKLFKSKSKDNNQMLWNAKMRFGKTLCALSVAKKMKSKHVLIITHRPEVDGTWYHWYLRVFKRKLKSYVYSSRNYGGISVNKLKNSHKNFIYFASLQDLDGSKYSGNGDDYKDKDIFDTHWDLLIIDEAHEGTQTEITQTLLQHLNFDKKLALSGTPFNLLASNKYKSDQICSWNYTDEQSYKARWNELDVGNTDMNNPYLTMPKLTIYTFSMGKEAQQKFVNRRTGYFNFHEFFKVNPKTHDFVYKDDVKKFLDYTTAGSTTNNYPYSDAKTRQQIKNTLWIMPSVASADALEKMLENHPAFDAYKIINVVKNDKSEDDEKTDDKARDASALEKVNTGMKENDYTITLTVRKLTLGVTVPKWSAVVFLSDTLSASQYLQSAFRCQSPYVSKDHNLKKTNCFVFDFSPNRALQIYADTANLNPKRYGNSISGSQKEAEHSEMQSQCKFMPIISVKGNSMTLYDVGRIDKALKQNYAEKVVQNGFDCNDLYNDDALMHLDSDDIKTLTAVHKTLKITPNRPSGLGSLHLGKGDIPTARKGSRKRSSHRSSQEKHAMNRVKKMKKARKWAIQCLRPISLRIPFIIYGMKPGDEHELDPSNFTDSIDCSSWKEFMPNGMSKSLFKRCINFYDIGVFIDAGKEIQQEVERVDHDAPLTRAMEIAKIFSQFHDPDNETVLTPWRTVNRHIGSIFGGASEFSNYDWKPARLQMLSPTSTEMFNPDTHILEISARSGLYSLYMVATLYYQEILRRRDRGQKPLNLSGKWSLWLKILNDNIFVIAQTPMARDVVIRTLVGYNNQRPKNVWSLEDFEKTSQAYFRKILNTKVTYNQSVTLDAKASANIKKQIAFSRMKKQIALSFNNRGKGIEKMKFDAVIGNPPYSKNDNASGTSISPIFQYFVNLSEQLSNRYVSLIIPAKWYTGGKGLKPFRLQMLDDKHLKTLNDYITSSKDVFPHTHIRGGVSIFLWDKKFDNSKKGVHVINIKNGKVIGDVHRPMRAGDVDVFIRDMFSAGVVKKIPLKESMYDVTSVGNPFKFRTYIINDKICHDNKRGMKDPVKIYGRHHHTGYIERKHFKKHISWVDKYKVFASRSNNIGIEIHDDNLNPFIGAPGTACTETFISIGADLDLNKQSAENLCKYLRTKFVRFLISVAKSGQDAFRPVYKFVPIQDFTNHSDIDWSKSEDEIDDQLFKKYGLTSAQQKKIRALVKSETK